ncbi:MAG: hypothetical protein RMM31_08520 [Anaerolineae bacterium]|nr:hypothetical protein [Anaerolineae bacterium]
MKTDQGRDAVKLVTNSTIEGRQLRQIFYLVDFGRQKLSVTYTRARNTGQQNDAAVEAIVKSIETLSEPQAAKGKRYVEPDDGEFSYVPPEGWELTDEPGSDYKSLRKDESFVVFQSGRLPGTLDANFRRAFRASLSALLNESGAGFQNAQIVEDSGFETEAGYDAAKFVINASILRQRVRVVMHVVDLDPVKVFVIYARPRSGSTADDEAIEAMVNTIAPADAADKPSGETGKAERYLERGGNFSYNIPAGWEVKQPEEVTGADLEFAALFGPASQDFAPNVVFVEDELPGSLVSYVRSLLRQLRSDSAYRSVSNSEEFKTDDGVTAARIVAERVAQNQRLRQVFYIFPERSRVIVATYSRLSQGNQSQFDEVVEAAMRSFRFGR